MHETGNNMENSIIPVILSGGSGTRLWPLSRELYPKQLLAFNDSNLTLLQATVTRLNGLTETQPVVVCNEHHRFMVAEQLLQLGFDKPSILLEPVGRNTAPAIAVAAFEVIKKHGDGYLLVLPADHLNENSSSFRGTPVVTIEPLRVSLWIPSLPAPGKPGIHEYL